MPFDPEENDTPCLVCGAPQWPSADEYLSEPSLGLISEIRPGQIQLAKEVEAVFAAKEPTVGLFEGGTGVGKSFAYLLPALLSRKVVMISTGKKTLQRQLFEKDAPLLLTKLGLPKATIAQLYGRTNYFCAKEAAKDLADYRVKELEDNSRESKTGLIADIHALRKRYSANYPLDDDTRCWKCIRPCMYKEQIKAFQEAQLGIINHWTCATVLRIDIETGGCGDKHSADVLIVDEAHTFVSALVDVFSNTLSPTLLTTKNIPIDYPYRKDILDLWDTLFHYPDKLLENAKAFKVLFERCLPGGIKYKTITSRLRDICHQLSPSWPVTAAVVNGNLVLFPTNVKSIIEHLYSLYPRVAFLSATLTVNNDFSYFKRELGGVPETVRVREAVVPSTFDYKKQALLYLSKSLPVPTREEDSKEDYRDKLTEEIAALLSANNGNAFVLFTAQDELLAVSARLLTKPDAFAKNLFVQTKNNVSTVLSTYLETSNATLVALKSFWEGIDIVGDKLSLIIFPRLPFPVREDPVIQTKRKAAGENAFACVDLPEMIITLRQGIGRLIRSNTDRGVIAILDSRLINARYKNTTLGSLGIPNVTTSLDATKKALINLNMKRTL